MALHSYKEAVMKNFACAVSDYVRNMPLQGRITSFQLEEGKRLLEGTFRNYKGFLICGSEVVQESIIDSIFLEQEVHHLQNHIVIVNFVGQAPELHTGWLCELQNLIEPEKILLHCKIGWRYSYIKLDSPTTTRKELSSHCTNSQMGWLYFKGGLQDMIQDNQLG